MNYYEINHFFSRLKFEFDLNRFLKFEFRFGLDVDHLS